MSEAREVLSLLLDARCEGRPAFASLHSDLDALVRAAPTKLEKVGAAFNLVGNAAIGMGLAVTAGVAMSMKAVSDWQAAQSRLLRQKSKAARSSAPPRR